MQMPNAVSSVAPLKTGERQTVDMEFELQPRAGNPLMYRGTNSGRRMVFTSGSELIDVPLSDKHGRFGSLLSSSFETTSGDEAAEEI